MRSILLLAFTLLLVSACAVASESGEAPDPVSSNVAPTSEAGAAAISAAVIDPRSCSGVLGPAIGTHSLETESFTETVQTSEQHIEAMCSASYETTVPGDPFLTVALIKFDSIEPAIDRYEMIKEGFVVNDLPISEVNSSDPGALDQLSALIDSDGMGRITVFRKQNWAISISVGPTTDVAPWTTGDLEMIGKSILERVL